MKKIVLVLVVFVIASRGAVSHQTIEVDYTELAEEAEMNKKNLLEFLNKTRVRQLYRMKYNSLLDKLGSTRRIVFGRNTSITALPWQASVREKTRSICGGSVVTDIWILTAAHCLVRNSILRVKAKDLSVRLGSSWRAHGGEIYDIKKLYVHPHYNHTENDAGLLRLYSSLRFSSRVLPIMIIGRASRLPANQMAIVSGWGNLREEGESAAFLQSTSIRTMAMKLCRQSGLHKHAISPASMFCAGSFSQPFQPDSCQGDSGGPIVSDGLQIGIVSWGLGCARGNFPGVYTRLSHPVIWDWIYGYITTKPDTNTTI